MTDTRASLITVALEWEQAGSQPPARSLRVLARLIEEARSQVGVTVTGPVELIVGVDASRRGDVESLLRARLPSAPGLFTVRLLPSHGLEYYGLKNACAAAATGEIIVFLDSDVVPEPGWLGSLLAPFADPAVSAVSGNTYVEATGTYSRTFALTWSFPLRTVSDAVGPLTQLRANNVAFRRDTAERFPFPSLPETSRRSCQVLKQSLIRHDVQIVTAGGARVAHPAPAGPRHFLQRALSQGRDRILYANPGPARTWRGTRRRLWLDFDGLLRRLLRHHDAVELPLAAVPAAIAISFTYALCCAVGELLTLTHRDFMVSHFRV